MGARIRIDNWKTVSDRRLRVFKLNEVAANPFGSSANVNIREDALAAARLPFACTFPAHSVTVLELQGLL